MASNKYRKKPIIVEAIQWNGNNYKEIKAFTDGTSKTVKTIEQIGTK